MEEATRKKLRNVVTQCRKLLEESIAQQLQGTFGIYAVKKDAVQIEDEVRMSHLSDENQQYRRDLLEHFDHIKARVFKPKDALDQLIREVAFTHLNRLCAYKMIEARDVYVGGKKFREAVSRGIRSNGFLMYLGTEGHEEDERLYRTGQQELAYRHFLDWLGGLLSDEIGVLFNPNDPANRLYPRQKTLDELLDLLNDVELAGIWEQDETIGWVYQYFTPKELRDKARKESSAPRNSYELAFRNQFFTPRYVVEFLTDNTLGRIWYEMRKGDTKLKNQCRYMVRRPTEIFLDDGQEPPETPESRGDLSQDELLKRPIHILYRPKKDPRELKILDPACGSGHFLLYCFDLLLTIYEEAYDDADLAPNLKADYPDKVAFAQTVPGLILAHNLHGIDIDLRASQIAALAQWLRCQRAFREMRLKERPKITRSNIVCAEPMPGEKEMLKEFTSNLKPRVLGQLVEVVFDEMKLAGEAGSLLKIEEELRDAIVEAKKQWLEAPKEVQLTLFESPRSPKKPEQLLFDTSGISDAEFWDEAESNVLSSLRDYATKTANGKVLQRQLFADDATRGFAFIDLCQQRFDVVLMNPPFGEMPETLLKYLTANYPQTKYDLATAFVECGFRYLQNGGRVGWISPRTWFSLSLLAPFREVLYANNALDSVLDLGIGVLDTALVEVACCTAQANGRPNESIFVARLLASKNKEADVGAIEFGNPSEDCIIATQLVAKLPRSAFAYWFPRDFAKHLQTVPRFDANGGEARQGLATTDDFRFLRMLWEVPPDFVGYSKRWVPFAKGGEYEPYYDDIHLVIDYADDGKALKEYLVNEKGQKHWSRRIASSGYYGRLGLTYPERTTSDLSLRPLPKGSIFSATGQSVFLADGSPPLTYLALSYTRLFKQILELYVGGGDASESGSAARDYTSGILNEMRVPTFPDADNERIQQLASEAISLRRDEFSNVEETCDFVLPVVLASEAPPQLTQAIDDAIAKYRADVTRLLEIGQLLDEWSCKIYELSRSDGNEFLSEEVCPMPTFYRGRDVPEKVQRDLSDCSMSKLVEDVCKKHGYRRAFTKKSYWANRRLELASHLLEVHPDSLSGLDICDVTRHLRAPVFDVISYMLGVVFGRWDIRVALGESSPSQRGSPFDSLPACSPGMLQREDCLPSTSTPQDYPIAVDWDGILVNDPEYQDDIVRRVREVLEVIWDDRAESIETEACEFLCTPTLRSFFQKPTKGGFWVEHVSRYTKSRRKAPIYWLLQSENQNYSLWLYYHRLDKDMLFKALLNYVEPKIQREENRLAELRSQKSSAGKTIPAREPRSSTATSRSRKTCSPSCGTSKRSSARSLTRTSSPTLTTAWFSTSPRSTNWSRGRKQKNTGTTSLTANTNGPPSENNCVRKDW